MTIASPNQRVCYYECSNGRFRLFYFIPPHELEVLIAQDLISRKVIFDFPDGVDLGCTQLDFTEFEKTYGYRPRIDPDTLRQAFFAMLSSTYNWKKFRGSGLIPAKDLEHQAGAIEAVIQKEDIESLAIKTPTDKMSLKKYRQIKRKQEVQKKKTITLLKKLQVKAIDPRKTMAKQTFSDIAMSAGENADDVFSKLLQRQQRGR